jgi:two-component system phosphate regulon response regulator PhoB
MTGPILICEDEKDLADVLEYNLGREGFTTRTVRNGQDCLTAAASDPVPSLILLDLMLPDMTGTEVCRRLRRDQRLQQVPIIMVTARTDEIDRVVGFEVGADDYVAKPFSVRELLLRVRAVLRRSKPVEGVPTVAGRVVFGVLEIDSEGHRAWAAGHALDLTALEFKLLSVFLARRGRALTREVLLRETWGADHHVTLRAVDTHVKRLRGKLGAAGDYIETIRGVGYRMRANPDDTSSSD